MYVRLKAWALEERNVIIAYIIYKQLLERNAASNLKRWASPHGATRKKRPRTLPVLMLNLNCNQGNLTRLASLRRELLEERQSTLPKTASGWYSQLQICDATKYHPIPSHKIRTHIFRFLHAINFSLYTVYNHENDYRK